MFGACWLQGTEETNFVVCMLYQDPHALAVLTETTSGDLQQYLADVRYQRGIPIVSALSSILFVEYHDDGIFPLQLLRHLTPPPNTNDNIEQPPTSQVGVTVEGDLEQFNGDSVRSDSLSVRYGAEGVRQLLYSCP